MLNLEDWAELLKNVREIKAFTRHTATKEDFGAINQEIRGLTKNVKRETEKMLTKANTIS